MTRFPALQSRDYRIFWIGQAVSLIGTWMQNAVQPYLAYRLTGQPIYLGLIGFAQTLPTLLFTLPGGVYVERMDKRRVVIVMQTVLMLQAFTLAYLAITGVITIWHIVVLAFIQGTAQSIEVTARQAMISELVGKEALPNAIGLNSTIFNVARIVGPTIAAPFLVLLKDTGEGWAFFANGISYSVVIISLFFVHTHAPEVASKERRSAILDFREGQKYILRTPVVATVILMASITGFFGFPYREQIPVFARDVLHVEGDTQDAVAARNSAMITISGIGALTAAMFVASQSTTFKRKGMLLMSGQIIFAASLLGVALSRSTPLTLLLMTTVGWGLVTTNTMSNTLVQTNVPPEIRGRVFSTYFWALQGSTPFGSLFMGWLAQTFGAPIALTVCASAILLVALFVHLRVPAVRQAEA